MTKNHNPAMHATMLPRYIRLAYTHSYIFAIKYARHIHLAFVRDARGILANITYCERNAESHGALYGLRMYNCKATSETILANAYATYDLGLATDFEADYLDRKANGYKGNRGNLLEDMVVDMFHAERPENINTSFAVAGDMVIDGTHFQMKIWNATFTTTSTLEKTEKRMGIGA